MKNENHLQQTFSCKRFVPKLQQILRGFARVMTLLHVKFPMEMHFVLVFQKCWGQINFYVLVTTKLV